MAVSRRMILAAASIRIRGILDDAEPAVPANALLAEDGTPILAEDGSYILTE